MTVSAENTTLIEATVEDLADEVPAPLAELPPAPRDTHAPSAPVPAKARIGDLLIKEGLITKEALKEALSAQKGKGGKVVENLIALGHLDTGTFLRFLSRQPGMASIDLLNYNIPREVINLVPAAFALKHELIPLDQMGKHLTIAMACPLDSKTIDELVQTTGMRIKTVLVSMSDMRVALERYYPSVKSKEFSMAGALAAVKPKPTHERAVEPAPPAPVIIALEPLFAVPAASQGPPRDRGSIIARIDALRALPAYPPILAALRKLKDDPEVSSESLAATLGRDPAIVARVIGLANAASYGFSHDVATVELAMTLLGLREIFGVITDASEPDEEGKESHFDHAAFWKRSVLAATAAKRLGQACGRKDLRVIFNAGLLHDIGRLVLAQVTGALYTQLDASQEDEQLIAAEEEVFGIAHPEAGYLLAQRWRLPGDLAEPICWHHDFTQATEFKEDTAIVALAALLADMYGRINKGNVRTFIEKCSPFLSALNLAEDELVRVLGEVAGTITGEWSLQKLT